MSQEDLGHAASVHPTALSNIETGSRSPRLSTILCLARALNVEPAKLFEGIG